MKFKPLPPVAELRRRFAYDPETGDLIHRIQSLPHAPAGSIAGSRGKHAIEVKVAGSVFMAHRLVWAIAHGEDPGEVLIDHINRDPFDNRLSNLRLGDSRLNAMNKKGSSRRGMPKGVTPSHRGNGYQARIQVRGKLKTLGTYPTIQEASAAYLSAAKEVAGEFAFAGEV